MYWSHQGRSSDACLVIHPRTPLTSRAAPTSIRTHGSQVDDSPSDPTTSAQKTKTPVAAATPPSHPTRNASDVAGTVKSSRIAESPGRVRPRCPAPVRGSSPSDRHDLCQGELVHPALLSRPLSRVLDEPGVGGQVGELEAPGLEPDHRAGPAAGL